MKSFLHNWLQAGVAICASLVFLILLAGCGGDPANKPLVVATEAQFPPFESKDASGKLVGFDIELIEAIAAKLDRKIVIQDMSFAGIIPAVQSGQVDAAISGMSVTEERKKAVLFSDPYIEAGLSILVGANNATIQSSADLAGKKVAVQQGATGAKAADDLKAKGSVGEVLYFQTGTLAMMELMKGGVEAVVQDTPYSQAFMKKNPGKIRALPQLLASDSYAIAFNPKSTELQAAVNKAIAELTADGTIEKLKVKYFGE